MLFLLATPAAAWEFTPGPICVLSHSEGDVEVTLTHDPVAPEFSITLSRGAPWPAGDVFSIAFARGPTISTNRHELGDGGRSLTVRDRGFGNVILGLLAGGTATAFIGETAVAFSLDGAAEPTADYAACAPVASA